MLEPSGDHCGLALRRPVAALSVSQTIFEVQSASEPQVVGTVAMSTKVSSEAPRPKDSKTSRSFVAPRRAVDRSLISALSAYGVSWCGCRPSGSARNRAALSRALLLRRKVT